ncbi:polysaccharide biosynthesis protein [Dulcicalothrix desertica PCC 7102]|uniref:Polysaccharide biosynthesis protein n=1 Tax=Dulcicalothrix desertica PCC 7102 TaxID=232991 RepID=A0A433VHR2_9CYAN|nr:flippase [Dulcicalothrix desertica]RUT05623.1 polysaccharide biosynthesis protein [Dulcicalothrix desertica PCC 7102]TWH54720.1 O-antigen/teichoic acid export membrane protein [Dulcicalothrix desertica PCC 7102]
MNKKENLQQTAPETTSSLLITLARGASSALAVQILNAALNYGFQVFLAQTIGATEYGVYEYATTLATFLAFPASLGFPTTVLRFIPEYIIKQDWAHLKGIVTGSWLQTLIASLIVSCTSTGVLLRLEVYYKLENTIALIIGVWGVPFLAIAILQQQMARGLHRIILALAPYMVVYPILFMVITMLWSVGHSLTSYNVLFCSILSLLIVTVGQLILLRLSFPREINYVKSSYALGQWWKVALVVIFLDGSNVILNQADTLMIGGMLGVKAVGVYGAAFKTSLWVNLLLTSINSIAAPMFASLYVKGDMVGLQKLVSTSVKWMFFPALAVGLGMIIFAEPVLRMFGEEFVSAKFVLIALILGQLVNVGAGSVGYLLQMTGHQNQCAVVVGISALVNIVLNLIGIRTLGILGAALATAFSMMLWNLWLHRLVVKHLGIRPSIVAALLTPCINR